MDVEKTTQDVAQPEAEVKKDVVPEVPEVPGEKKVEEPKEAEEKKEAEPEKKVEEAEASEEKKLEEPKETEEKKVEEPKATTSAPLKHLEKQVKKQVEFWFGDSNIIRDKFLMEQIQQDGGWVPLSVLTTFNRMKSLTTDISFIAQSLATSEFLEVNAEGTKLKRTTPLPEKDTSAERSVEVSGFPKKDVGATIEKISDFFKGQGEVKSVRIKKHSGTGFAYIAFVEFASVEIAKKVGEIGIFQWNDEDTIKAVYVFKTPEERAQNKRKRDDKGDDRDDSKRQQVPPVLTFTPSVLLVVKGLEADTGRDDIQAFLSKYGVVKYVDSREHETVGHVVRFTEEAGPKAAFEGLKTEKMLDVEVTATVMGGDEETTYWKEKIEPFMKAGGRGRGRGRGGRGRGRRGRGRR